MTATSLWQLDRVSPEARAAAEATAQASGMALSHWLGRVIAETCAAEGVVLAAAPRTVPPAPRAIFEQVPPPRPAAPVQLRPVPQPAIRVVPPPAPQVAAPVAGQPALPLDVTTLMLPPTALEPGPVGTRGDEAEAPEALVAAIAREGMYQPILARRKPGADGRYEIIAGRRRWRAAKRLGLSQVAVVVTNFADPEAILASLAENLGEGNLSPLDEAKAYLRLLTEFSLDPRDVSAATGRDMTHIVRTLRLLGLPPAVRDMISSGRITRGNAYTLLDQPDPERAAAQMVSDQSGVDEALRRIAAITPGKN